jgi:hypothetical protein
MGIREHLDHGDAVDHVAEHDLRLVGDLAAALDVTCRWLRCRVPFHS